MRNAEDLTTSHFSGCGGAQDFPSMTPDHELLQRTWTNGAIQTTAGNPIHSQYHDIDDNQDFLLCHPEVQFSNRGLSSINWLPLSDPSFENWDFTAPSFDIMNNFANGEISYETLNMGTYHDHISPRETAPGSIHSESHSSSSRNRDDRLGYYVDGDGGRATTKSAQLRRNRSISNEVTSQHSGPSHANQAMSTSPQIEQEREKVHDLISLEVYEEIRNSSRTNPFSIALWSDLKGYVQLYFEKFHILFPLVHKNNFGQQRGESILVVATAAVGAAYGGTLESHQRSEELYEFLYKTLEKLETITDSEDQMFGDDLFKDRTRVHSIVVLQARVLSVIGMLHSGNQRLIRLAYSSHSALTTACYNMDLLRPADRNYLSDHLSEVEKQREWLAEQIRIRTGYFIWVRHS